MSAIFSIPSCPSCFTLASSEGGLFSSCRQRVRVACVVGVIASVILMGLGGAFTFGPTGSLGFNAALATGGVLGLISVGGLLWTILAHNQTGQTDQTQITSHLVSSSSDTSTHAIPHTLAPQMGGQNRIEPAPLVSPHLQEIALSPFKMKPRQGNTLYQGIFRITTANVAMLPSSIHTLQKVGHFIGGLFKKSRCRSCAILLTGVEWWADPADLFSDRRGSIV